MAKRLRYCQICGGRGEIYRQIQHGPATVVQVRSCRYCAGVGYYPVVVTEPAAVASTKPAQRRKKKKRR